jgi:hypothetical protein
MFGSNRDDQQSTTQSQDQNGQQSVDGLLPAHATPDDPAIQQSVDAMMSQSAPALDTPAADDYIMTDAPTPAATPDPVASPAPAPAGDTGTPIPVNKGTSDELLALKQEALQQLSPLVGKLDQNPVDKFRTTMMMLQSTDDQSLVRVAYDAAREITDEKLKAQALLDVINEINYFTQKNA